MLVWQVGSTHSPLRNSQKVDASRPLLYKGRCKAYFQSTRLAERIRRLDIGKGFNILKDRDQVEYGLRSHGCLHAPCSDHEGMSPANKLSSWSPMAM